MSDENYGVSITGDNSIFDKNIEHSTELVRILNAELERTNALSGRGLPPPGGGAGDSGGAGTGGGTNRGGEPPIYYGDRKIRVSQTDSGTGQVSRSVSMSDTGEFAGMPATFTRTERQTSGINVQREFDISARAADSAAASMSRFSDAEFEASLKGKPLEDQLRMIETRMSSMGQADPARVSLGGRLETLKPRIDAEQSSAISAAARATDVAAASTAKFSAAEFEATLQGKSYAEQLQLIETRMSSMGAADEGRVALQGRASSLTSKIGTQEEKNVDRILRQFDQREAAQFNAQVSGMSKSDAIEAYTRRLAVLDEGSKEFSQTQSRMNAMLGEGNSKFGMMAEKIATSIIIWEGMRYVAQTITQVVDAQIKLSGEVARFAIVTGTSIDFAKSKYVELQGVMARQGIAPSQAGDTIQTVARFTKVPAEQENLVDVASKMSQVFNIPVSDASQKLIAILQQEKRAASEVGAVFDELLAVYKATGSSVDDIVNAFTEAAIVQDKWNTTSLETKGLIAELSQATDESAETVTGALTRINNEIQNLEGSKLVEVSSMFRGMGIEIQDTATGKLLPALEVIKNIASKFGGLSSDDKAKIYQAIGLEKPTYQQIGRELMSALADGIVGNLKVVADAGAQAGKAFMDSFQGATNQMKAQQELLQENGGILQNLSASILSGTVGKLGKGGAQFVEKTIESQNLATMFGTPTGLEDNKERFLKSLYGLSLDEARAAISEYNAQIAIATINAQTANPLDFSISDRARKALVSGEEGLKAVSAKPASVSTGTTDAVERATARAKAAVAKDISAPAPESIDTPERKLQDRIRNTPNYLTTSSIDVSKLSTDQYNSALRESEQLFYAIIAAQRMEMQLAHMKPAEIEKAVAAMIEEAKIQEVLVERAGKQFEYVRGIAGVNLKDILGQDEFKPTDFQFQRLRNIEPSQAPQLQALITMYTQALAKMGSPEKSVTINTLMGEGNSFKQFNGSMTALQMALEDLTKVEKAQLSGTWNMPAGATALVPITSLDLQRWNKSSGGIDMEALKGLMGVTQGSGDKVAGAMGTAADRITAAIREQYDKAGVPHTEQDVTSASLIAQNAIKAALSAAGFGIPQLAAIGSSRTAGEQATPLNGMQMWQSMLKALQPPLQLEKSQVNTQAAVGPLQSYRDMEEYRSLLKDSDTNPGQFKSSIPSYRQQMTAPKVDVNVSMLPLKATFNANIMVTLNGAVLARALMPIMYQQFARALVGEGVGQKGAIR